MSAIKIMALQGVNDEPLCRMIEKLLATIQGVDSAEINSFSQTLTLCIDSNDVALTVQKVVQALKNVDANIVVDKIDVGDMSRQSKRSASLYRGVNPYGIDDDEAEDELAYEPMHGRWREDDFDDEEDEDDRGTDVHQVKERKVKGQKIKADKPPKLERKRIPLPLSESLLRGLVGIALGGVICIVVNAMRGGTAEFVLSLIAYLIAAAFALRGVLGKGGNREFLPETVAVVVAAALGFAVGSYRGAAFAMLAGLAGQLLLAYTQERFLHTRQGLGDIHSPTVLRKLGDQIAQVPFDEILVGDHIVIKPNEVIPFDGVVAEGPSQIDAAMLKGREFIKPVQSGDTVLCGYRNLKNTITVQVERRMEESEAAQIISAIADNTQLPTELELKAGKISLIMLGGGAALALILAFLSVLPIPVAGAVMMNRSILMIALASPCGLGVSVMMALHYGMFGAFDNHIFIRGTQTIELASNVKTVAMGMTGTLTRGSYQVVDIVTEAYTEAEILEFAAYAESGSDHPLARAIVEKYCEFSGEEIQPERMSMTEQIRGRGARAMMERTVILVGSRQLMEDAGTEFAPISTNHTVVYVAVRGEYAGAILLEDTLKPGATELAEELKKQGVQRLVLLTGCDGEQAQNLAEELQLDEVHAELSGKGKLMHTQNMSGDAAQRMMMIGSSRADEPFLSSADVGMGIGSGLATSSFAQLEVPSGDLTQVPGALQLCKSIRSVAWQNIILFGATKLVLILCSFYGQITLFPMVCVNVVLSLVLALNAFRAMYLHTTPTPEAADK